MSFALIDAKRADVPVDTACAVLNVSVSGYYAWKNRDASPRQRRDLVLLANIRAQFATSNETYGSPRMHVELNEDGLAVGRHRVARIMRDNDLKARQIATTAGQLQQTFSTKTLPQTVRIRNGALIYRTSGPPKVGSILRSS